MPQTAAAYGAKSASLDPLYRLVKQDLARVDALILSRVENEVALIGNVARHIIASGGKRIRPALTLISAQLCGYKGERHVELAAAIEFIHTATLLHDDVVDESKLRRGLPTANELYDNKASILVGDFLFSQAFQLMVRGDALKVPRILSDASAIIAKGEVMQLMAEGDLETGVESYLKVISCKTAELFASACQLGAVVAGRIDVEKALHEFGMHVGIAFQLIDDALDYAAHEETLGKQLGDDFREGKITLPVIIAYRAADAQERAFWNRTLAEHRQQPGDLAIAVGLLKKHDALGQTVKMAEDYCENARRALAGFPPTPARDAMLDIIDFCISRAY